MLNLVFLSEAFYDEHKKCAEIEQKKDRPYTRIEISMDGVIWCIPFRSNINHPNAIWTDAEKRCGIDLTKAVVVTDPVKQIDRTKKPHLRDNEFDVVKRLDQFWVGKKLRQYIKMYKKAKMNMSIKRNRKLVQYSTLQYFEDYL